MTSRAMRSLPNALTMARALATPLVVAAFYLPQPAASWTAFLLFVLAGITDWLDGHLARKWRVTSNFGRFLDPIADKLLVAAILLMLVARDWLGGIHVLAALVILMREILVSGLREHLAALKVRLPVTRLAKWKTAVQMIAIGALILAPAGDPLGLPASAVGVWGLWIAAVLTIVTGYDYLVAALRHMD